MFRLQHCFVLSAIGAYLLASAQVIKHTSSDRSEALDIRRGYWSGKAISLFNTSNAVDPVPNRELTLYSPDRAKLVQVHDQRVSVFLGDKKSPTDFWSKTSAELGWSPDSARFFLTWTRGGNLGDWHVAVYDVSAAGVKEVKGIERNPIKDFEKYVRSLPLDPEFRNLPSGMGHYCYSNVAAAQWLNGSSELLLSVMVEPEGDCWYSEEFLVYRVAIPSGRILQRYTAKDAHRIFDPENLPIITRR